MPRCWRSARFPTLGVMVWRWVRAVTLPLMVTARAVEFHPDLVGWPHTRPVRGALVGVVNTLGEQNEVLVRLGEPG